MGLRDGFLSSGVTRATLKEEGNGPLVNEALITCVIAGKTVGDMAWRRLDGIGSNGPVVGRLSHSLSSVKMAPTRPSQIWLKKLKVVHTLLNRYSPKY